MIYHLKFKISLDINFMMCGKRNYEMWEKNYDVWGKKL